MTDIKKQKAALRETYLQKRRAIPTEQKLEYDKKLCGAIINSVSYKYYDTLLLFSALPDEPDLHELAVRALSDGKSVAYPRCVRGERKMIFRYVKSLGELKRGSFGIPEPDEEAPSFDPSSPSCSVCFIPAVLADKNGYRIGYGGGYYDRFLSDFQGTAATVVYSDFIIPAVPHGKYDAAADMIITEGGITRIVKKD